MVLCQAAWKFLESFMNFSSEISIKVEENEVRLIDIEGLDAQFEELHSFGRILNI